MWCKRLASPWGCIQTDIWLLLITSILTHLLLLLQMQTGPESYLFNFCKQGKERKLCYQTFQTYWSEIELEGDDPQRGRGWLCILSGAFFDAEGAEKWELLENFEKNRRTSHLFGAAGAEDFGELLCLSTKFSQFCKNWAYRKSQNAFRKIKEIKSLRW